MLNAGHHAVHTRSPLDGSEMGHCKALVLPFPSFELIATLCWSWHSTTNTPGGKSQARRASPLEI